MIDKLICDNTFENVRTLGDKTLIDEHIATAVLRHYRANKEAYSNTPLVDIVLLAELLEITPEIEDPAFSTTLQHLCKWEIINFVRGYCTASNTTPREALTALYHITLRPPYVRENPTRERYA